MTVLAASIPPISKEFFDKLTQSFPPVKPEPNITTMDEIMCGAGEQRVLDWIRAHATQESYVTNVDVSKSMRLR